jgi:hypothetical protein
MGNLKQAGIALGIRNALHCCIEDNSSTYAISIALDQPNGEARMGEVGGGKTR